ncbi:unnamed protein product, partial [Mesorhabditis belari]|uniref:Uncharacterized protein n=1 Tax=Mesorhabditis belari TaxID=2138241 RepID=A0AAF3ENT1_9BILA
MINFIIPNDTWVKIYNFLHPQLLEVYTNQCQSNLALMRLEPDVTRGITYGLVGIIYECLYFLCMIAMCQWKFLKIICYRILFVIGIFDMLGLVASSLLPGYLLITGRSFCQSPLLNLFVGSMAFPGWAVYSGLSISLAINRCVDFMWSNKQEKIFGGKMMILWTGIPVAYGLILYLKLSPMLYHVPTASYYFGADPAKAQAPIIYPINNGAVAVLILLLNLAMLWGMFRMNHRTMTKTQRAIMIQCLGISMSVLLTGWLYVAMQFITMPLFMITVANLCWQFSNGSLGVFYILVNKSMRGEVLKLLRISSCRNSSIYTASTDQKITTAVTNTENR